VQITLKRDDAGSPWVMVSPYEAAADQELVNELVGEVQFGTGGRFIDDPEDLRDYGLDPPNVRITVMDEKNTGAQTLFLGSVDSAEAQGGLFARRKDRNAVFLMSPHIMTLLPRSPSAFREQRLLTRQAREIRSLHYVGRGEDFLLEKEGEAWRMVHPEQADTDQTAVSAYVSMLKQTRGQRFPDSTLADLGLDVPELSITIAFADGGPDGIIRLGPNAASENYYNATQDNGTPTQIHVAEAKDLFAESERFRSRLLLRFAKNDAVKIAFDFEGQAYVFEMLHGKWILRAPETKQLVNQGDVDILLDALSPIFSRGTEPGADGNLEAYGLTAPLFSVHVTTKSPDAEDEETRHGPLCVGSPTKGDSQLRYATSADRQGVFHVRQDVIDAVREALRGLKERDS